MRKFFAMLLMVLITSVLFNNYNNVSAAPDDDVGIVMCDNVENNLINSKITDSEIAGYGLVVNSPDAVLIFGPMENNSVENLYAKGNTDDIYNYYDEVTGEITLQEKDVSILIKTVYPLEIPLITNIRASKRDCKLCFRSASLHYV